jgi:hypothetical protein
MMTLQQIIYSKHDYGKLTGNWYSEEIYGQVESFIYSN